MTRRLTREEAARVLEVPAGANGVEVKRAYRRLVRCHHPDAGGDPATFQQLQRAYERLSEQPVDALPRVARGRPSRPHVPFVDEAEQVDLTGIDLDLLPPEPGARLDVDRLTAWLRSGPAPLRTMAATSRAPRSRLNRLAHVLAPELTSRLEIATGSDDRGGQVVTIQVVASTRRARRAVERIKVRGGWVRTRGSTSTVLRLRLVPSQDERMTVVRAARRLDALLEELAWPLSAWTLTGETTR